MGTLRLRWRNFFLHLLLILAAVIAVFPFLWMISTSLKDQMEVYALVPSLIPKSWRWENYREVLQQIPFGRMYFNTIFVSVCRTLGEVIFASMAGYAFARIRFRGKEFIFIAILAIMMIPAQITLVPNYILLKNLGWLDTYQGLIIPRMFSAYGTFLFRQFFLTLPNDITDASKIDGCNPLQTFYYVALPLGRTVLIAFGFLSLLYAWNDFLWPLIISTSMDMNVLSVGVTFFQSQNITNFALTMAASTMSILPILLVFIVAQRYLIEGITLTGMK